VSASYLWTAEQHTLCDTTCVSAFGTGDQEAPCFGGFFEVLGQNLADPCAVQHLP
jgi:hypothetical protein